jgi:predicted transposase YbfD/YdcC
MDDALKEMLMESLPSRSSTISIRENKHGHSVRGAIITVEVKEKNSRTSIHVHNPPRLSLHYTSDVWTRHDDLSRRPQVSGRMEGAEKKDKINLLGEF